MKLADAVDLVVGLGLIGLGMFMQAEPLERWIAMGLGFLILRPSEEKKP